MTIQSWWTLLMLVICLNFIRIGWGWRMLAGVVVALLAWILAVSFSTGMH